MRTLRSLLMLGTAAGAAAGCGDYLAAPRGLEFVATVSPSVIRVGQSGTLHIRLRNTSQRTVTFSFPSSCQIVPYIETAFGATVYPEGGGWGCFQALTTLELAPGAERVQTVEVIGGTGPFPAIHGGVALAPGSYRAHAEIGVPPRLQGKSSTATFRVVE